MSLIALDGSEYFTHKVASTPSAPSKAVARGISELLSSIESSPRTIANFVHGTTIALNAVLERRGARCALIVSSGNRDILEIARLRKTGIFNLKSDVPAPIIERRDVIEVPLRGDDKDRSSLEAIADKVLAVLPSEIDSAAICLLNAYKGSDVERGLADALCARRPGLHISCSSDLWPEIREYERGSVAALNAYVQPIMSAYVDNLKADTSGVGLEAPLQITQSNGGVLAASSAKTKPVNTMLSGPASGVVGAAFVSSLSGVHDAVTLDIGGTSADFSIIRDGQPVHSTEAVVGDFPLVMPSVDVFAVGAGGGSIAWFDPFGVLKLGPMSAGAEPGPACYGRGGNRPTITDAYLVSGFIDPDRFVGGTMQLSRENAVKAVGGIAEQLGCSAEQASEAILRLGTATMTSAILPMMTKRGLDPRDFTLVAFGGAGPTHACLLAEEIGIQQVLVPPSPGTMCALGATIADYKSNHIRSMRGPLAAFSAADLQACFAELEQEGRDRLSAESERIEVVEVVRSADLRYRGQAFDVDVTLPEGVRLDEIDPDYLARLFHETYEKLYSNHDPASPIELMALRVVSTGRRPRPDLPRLNERHAAAGSLEVGERRLFYGNRFRNAAVYRRDALMAGDTIAGPAIVEQFDTTTFIVPGFIGACDAVGNLLVSKAE
ncbi:hydantoinase/oxoprolinase family protein [Amorphus sp. 3PC139-8]